MHDWFLSNHPVTHHPVYPLRSLLAPLQRWLALYVLGLHFLVDSLQGGMMLLQVGQCTLSHHFILSHITSHIIISYSLIYHCTISLHIIYVIAGRSMHSYRSTAPTLLLAFTLPSTTSSMYSTSSTIPNPIPIPHHTHIIRFT